MASMTITVPEAQLAEVEEAFCVPEHLAITGPNTKKAVERLLRRHVQAYFEQKKEAELPPVAQPEVTVT